MRSKKIIRMTSSRSPSEIGGSLADSDSLRSRESNRPKLSEVHWLGGSSIINLLCKCLMKSLSKVKFGIKRLMEDLDSGQGGEEEFESDLILNLFFASVVCYSNGQLLEKCILKVFSPQEHLFSLAVDSWGRTWRSTGDFTPITSQEYVYVGRVEYNLRTRRVGFVQSLQLWILLSDIKRCILGLTSF